MVIISGIMDWSIRDIERVRTQYRGFLRNSKRIELRFSTTLKKKMVYPTGGHHIYLGGIDHE